MQKASLSAVRVEVEGREIEMLLKVCKERQEFTLYYSNKLLKKSIF